MKQHNNLLRFLLPSYLFLGIDGEPAGGGESPDTTSTPSEGSGTLLGGTGTPSEPPRSPEPTGAEEKVGLGSIYSGEEGALNPDTLDKLPDEWKELKPLFSKYKTEKDLAQGIKNLQYLAGKKGMDVLPDDAPQSVKDEQAALLRKINRVPETPEGYDVKKPEDLPEGVEWNEEAVKGYLDVLHKHNASPALVQELLKMDSERATMGQQGAEQQVQAQLTQEREALQEAWGAKFDEKLSLAQRGARAIGLDVNDPAVGNNSKLIQAMARVADMVSEDRLPSGDNGQSGAGDDRQKALDIVNNQNNPLYQAFHNQDDPRHEEAVRIRSQFNQRWHERQRKG